MTRTFTGIDDIYHTVYVDTAQDAGIKVLPNTFHKDGTLNEQVLDERNGRLAWHRAKFAVYQRDMAWLEELRLSRSKEEKSDVRGAWIASVAPFVIAIIVAVALVVAK